MYTAEYNERVQLFRDAMQFKKPKRTPHMSNFFTWKVFDSPYSLREAIYDYKKMEEVTVDFHNRYHFDAYLDLGIRNFLRVTDPLGGSGHQLNEEGTAINVVDQVLIQPEEYLEYAKNPKKYWRILFQRAFPTVDAQKMGQAMSEMMTYGQFVQRMPKLFSEKYSTPSVFNLSGAILNPYEFFNGCCRGMKGLSIDMRRNKKELKAALDAHFEQITWPSLHAQLQSDTSDYIVDVYTALLGYNMMNKAQFEFFYWPYLKKMIDAVIEADKTMYIFCESTMLRFADYFQDIPKGHVIMHLEQDDIFEVREKLPNICLAGGLSTDLLGNGTPEECVAHAKELIDKMGPGFVLSQNRMVSFKNDCKRENMLAVCDFVRSYQPEWEA